MLAHLLDIKFLLVIVVNTFLNSCIFSVIKSVMALCP